MTADAIADRTKHHEVIVNGREKAVTIDELTFDEIVALAYDPVPSGPSWVFTITFRRGGGHKPEGTLQRGESVKVKEGMIFNVTATDKS